MNKMIITAFLSASAIFAIGTAVSAAPAQPPQSGAALYQSRCGGCHSIATNRIGPAHKGVFGRPAGKAPGFNYSPALRRSTIVWNDTTLDRWLQGPQRVVPGTRMFFTVPNRAERAAIIAYLKSDAAK